VTAREAFSEDHRITAVQARPPNPHARLCRAADSQSRGELRRQHRRHPLGAPCDYLPGVRADLEGTVAVVTGAGRGIGRAVAERLAAAGAAVGLVARSAVQLEEAAASIWEKGGRAITLTADVTEPGSVEQMMARVQLTLGPVDLLVNNAGKCDAIGPLWEVDPDAWWGDIRTNLLGTALCSRAVLPSMVARRSGRIVNVSSYAAVRPSPSMTAYGSAKAAVVHLTNSLAAETKEYGVSIFAITPGTVRTALTEQLTDSAAGRQWLPPIPPERWLSPERVAQLVVSLATGKADRMSGRFIHVLDDVADLAQRADVIEREDLYVLRLRK
jgi:NAD(P)-dependent dehydrogenase (short-subunit alcohol dehydrogenase family)